MKNFKTFAKFVNEMHDRMLPEVESVNEAYDVVMKDSDIENKFIGKKVQRELERHKNLAVKYKEQLDNFKKEFGALKKFLSTIDKNYGTTSYLSYPRHSHNDAKFKIVVEYQGDPMDFAGDKVLKTIENFIKDSKSMFGIGAGGHGVPFSDLGKFEYYDHIPGYVMTVGGRS